MNGLMIVLQQMYLFPKFLLYILELMFNYYLHWLQHQQLALCVATVEKHFIMCSHHAYYGGRSW